MGFRFICKHCEKDKFYVSVDVTHGGMVSECSIHLICISCKNEFIMTPKIEWDLVDYSHATVRALTDDGKVIEFHMEDVETVIQKREKE